MNVIIPKYIKDYIFYSENLRLGFSEMLNISEENDSSEVKVVLDPRDTAWGSSTEGSGSEGIWSTSTTYATDEIVDFLPEKGSRDEGQWKQYKSLIDENIAHIPPTYGTDASWTDLGTINKFKAVDYYVNTQLETSTLISSKNGSLKIRFRTRTLTSVALINIKAATYKISMWEGTSIDYSTAKTMTIPATLLNTPTVKKLYSKTRSYVEWMFQPFDFSINKVESMPGSLYPNIICEIEFGQYSNEEIKIGAIIPGISKEIGNLQIGVSTGIKDYSRKITDESFGETYLKKGNYKDTLDGDVLFLQTEKDDINNILRQIRATPTVFNGNQYESDFTDFIIYGYISSFNIIHSGYNHCTANIEIEGLI